MPVRGMKAAERPQLNAMLEAAYKGADRDHRFVRLHQQKPIINDYSRVYEYDPAAETGLPLPEKRFVAHCGIWPQEVQYGQATLLNGGVRDVASDSAVARGKGYGLRVMEDAKNFMYEREIDFSVLFSGANHFYEKLGWRGGMPRNQFDLPAEEFTKWRSKHSPLERAVLRDVSVRVLQLADFPAIADIHNRALPGQYFAACRSGPYLQSHYDVNPAIFLNTVVIEYQARPAGYVTFNLRENETTVITSIMEAQVDPSTCTDNSAFLSAANHAFFAFLEEEAIDAKKRSLGGLELMLSPSNPLVAHFQRTGYHLADRSGINLGIMCLITNPYSLFEKLVPEIQARAARGELPAGECFLQFDLSGKFPGGVKIAHRGAACSVSILRETASQGISEGTSPASIAFDSISDLTMFFAGIIPPAEVTEDGEKEYGVHCTAGGHRWLVGLFKNITNDLYSMDHY